MKRRSPELRLSRREVKWRKGTNDLGVAQWSERNSLVEVTEDGWAEKGKENVSQANGAQSRNRRKGGGLSTWQLRQRRLMSLNKVENAENEKKGKMKSGVCRGHERDTRE